MVQCENKGIEWLKKEKRALRAKFDGKLKLGFHGATISSDAGLWVYGELDEGLGLTADLEDMIDEPRMGKNPTQTDRFVNDAEWLRVDPSV